jgi:two-component system sensor histidine kinase RegB
MAIVLDEIRERSDDPGAVESAVDTVSEQLAACRETLDSLFDYGRKTFAAGGPPVAFDAFLRACVAAFGARRPEARVTFTVDTPGPPPLTPADPGLRQALLNLLANAADVSPHAIELRVNWDDRWIRIVVRDRGPGIRSDIEDNLGSLFFTTKAHGRGTGLGLYLAHTAVRRLGGQLLLGNAAGGGAAAEIRLPVAPMDRLDLDLIGRQ